ncbi:MAG: hypothetical protein SGJ27_30845 [Candidatus Melainabacteria bacterium]|nr:hypothetical protein [Candidatus Melainabacteria bacterium]
MQMPPDLLARELLNKPEDAMQEIKVHDFDFAVASNDDDYLRRLNKEFAEAFDLTVLDLVAAFGEAS